MPPKKEKKKLSKKEKLKLAMELAEKKKREAEMERQRQIQEEKRRIEMDKRKAMEKAQRDMEEQIMRNAQLNTSFEVLKQLWQKAHKAHIKDRRHEEWEQYMKCDGLPDPADVPQMHTFLYLWQQEDDNIDAVVKKTDIILQLLNKLDEHIDLHTDVGSKKVENWKEVRQEFRTEQQRHLDNAVYKLLSNVDENMELIGLNEVRFRAACPHLLLLLWGLLPLPRGLDPPPDEPRPTKMCEFAEMNLEVQLPQSLTDVDLVVRAMRLKYDHYSDQCRSWDLENFITDEGTSEKDQKERLIRTLKKEVVHLIEEAVAPKFVHEESSSITDLRDLRETTTKEWLEKQGLQKQVDEELEAQTKQRSEILAQMIALQPLPSKPSAGPRGKASEPPPEQPDFALMLSEIPPVRTTSQLFEEIEDELEKNLFRSMAYAPACHELNLRRFAVLCGVLHLDLLQQLPQPQKLPHNWIIVTVPLPKVLQMVEWRQPYQPPPPPEPGQTRLPEEIEAELKEQEEKLNQLALVSIALPEDVLWFEPPTVVRWDSEQGYWSKEDCHDIKFNEEKQIITFRLGQFGPLGLAAYRYFNLPFQTWEMKPDPKTGITIFNITAAVLIIEFQIKDDKVCLTALQNGATAALQNIVGTCFKPYNLIKLMRRGGVDIFPSLDTACYVEGCVAKHRAAEDHLYHCMALASSTYNFAWSRWNQPAGRRNIVLQMREYFDRKNLANHSTLHVTPLKACIIDCTEMSQEFEPQNVIGKKFHADLYHLHQEGASSHALRGMAELSPLHMHSVYTMLSATRILSFS